MREYTLPELPDGMYWRVFKDRHPLTHRDRIHVAMMRKRRFFFDKCLTLAECYPMRPADRESVRYAISRAAFVLLEKYNEKNAIDSLMGNYPPKKL